jgi:hypothetical protein
MTGTNCDLFTQNQSRSYLNHLVYSLSQPLQLGHIITIVMNVGEVRVGLQSCQCNVGRLFCSSVSQYFFFSLILSRIIKFSVTDFTTVTHTSYILLPFKIIAAVIDRRVSFFFLVCVIVVFVGRTKRGGGGLNHVVGLM